MADDSSNLYRQWLDVLPVLLSALTPQPAAVAARPREPQFTSEAGLDPTHFVRRTLGLTDGALSQMAQTWAPLLQAGASPVELLRSIVATQRQGLDLARHSLVQSDDVRRVVQLAEAVWPAWVKPVLAADGPFSLSAANPLQTGTDRGLGALANSFSLTAPRALLDSARQLAEAEVERRLAMADFLGVVGGAIDDALQRALARLDAMHNEGGAVDSLLGLFRLWTRAVDAAMHQALQSPSGVEAAARLVRASTDRQLRTQALVAQVSNAIGLPTQADVDDAYREIQALKRALRRMRRADKQVPGEPETVEEAAARSSIATKRATPVRTRTRSRSQAA